MKKAIGFLRLMRPANIVTAVADVLAGAVVSGLVIYGEDCSGVDYNRPHIIDLLLLCCSTACLYGGGIVFNDVFDAELDKVERPERPIPSGLISIREASILGSVLLISGVAAAFIVSVLSGSIAILIAACALIYDKLAKHHSFLGPLNMGTCRGLNLLLGLSIVPASMLNLWFVGLVPLLYIFSITMISRAEVHGGRKITIGIAAFLYAIVIAAILIFYFLNKGSQYTGALLLGFGWMIYQPLFKAWREPIGPNIGKAVKAGVLGLIFMDASWAAASGNLPMAILILCLLPISIGLARIFAVT